MGWLTNRYNKKTSKKYGWLPSWFGEDLDSFDSDLEAAVKAFQKDHDLSADGKVIYTAENLKVGLFKS